MEILQDAPLGVQCLVLWTKKGCGPGNETSSILPFFAKAHANGQGSGSTQPGDGFRSSPWSYPHFSVKVPGLDTIDDGLTKRHDQSELHIQQDKEKVHTGDGRSKITSNLNGRWPRTCAFHSSVSDMRLGKPLRWGYTQ